MKRGLPIASPVEDTTNPPMSIDVLLERVVELNASDLHITAGAPPIIRVRGSLVALDGYPLLTPEMTRDLLYRILSTEKQKHLEIDRQIDLSYGVGGPGPLPHERLSPARKRRCGVPHDPGELQTLEELGLPASLNDSPTSRAASCS